MASVYDLIRTAILCKKQVIAVYDGYPREMCPHVLGLKKGVRHVLSYQFGGESSRGLPPSGEWKCMQVDALSQVALRDGQWFTGTRKTNKPQSCVDQVDVEVSG